MSVIPFTGNEMPVRPSRDSIATRLTVDTRFPRYRQPDPEEIRMMLSMQAQYTQSDLTREETHMSTLRRDMEQYLHSTDVDCVPCRKSE